MANLKGLVGNDQSLADVRDLELIHASLDDDIADVRLMRGPWCPSRIPPEILCEIFHFYLLFLHASAWTISQVCRAWRRIAIGCPTLWNTLRITSRAIAYRSRHFALGRDCHVTELQVQRAIRRTREATLWIELELRDKPQNPSAMLRVLRIVAGHNLARWRSLVWFDSTIGIGLASVLRQVFLPTQEMTSLRHLSLRYRHCDLLLPALNAGVPSLTSLQVGLDNGEPPTMLMNQPWLGRLKKLTLVYLGHDRPQLDRVGPMVGKCKALEELNLRRNTDSLLSGESFGSIRWPPLPRGLRTILFHTHANFWPCVSSTNITSLALRMENDIMETLSVAPRSISLPSLTNLECFSYETTFIAGYLLDAPKTQSMSILHWKPGSITAGIRDIFRDKPWGIYPIKVSLQTHIRHRTTLQDLFLRLSKTNTLSLCFWSISVDPLLELIPGLESRGDTVVLPNLTRVECEFRDRLPNSQVSRIDGIIQAIQDTRGYVGVPRPFLRVSFFH
jgi:hypothetical protein